MPRGKINNSDDDGFVPQPSKISLFLCNGGPAWGTTIRPNSQISPNKKPAQGGLSDSNVQLAERIFQAAGSSVVKAGAAGVPALYAEL
jgi:hypothetical protein